MLPKLKKLLEKPELYAETICAFWNDDHISKQMLQAHLDPDFEGASRKLDFIEKSVSWIKKTIPPKDYPLLMDIGCGPGIYAERFAKVGFQVTGIDFSRRSINYAQNSALLAKLNIHYLYQNYLTLHLNIMFDFTTMIYCDYGALSSNNRKILLQKIYHHLKPGGKFLLDVFSMVAYNNFSEQQNWEIYPDGGFWHKEEYLAINKFHKYNDNVTLEQIAIIAHNKKALYYLWNTYFSAETLIKEVTAIGFTVCEILGDVLGSPYSKESPTIAIILQK